jgi:protein-S-isoprenylcysteine O-methyltransferase Ste14
LFLALFRIFLYPLIALSILSFEADSGSLLEHILGAIMLLVGFGFAFQITFRMGWKNAFGEKQGLRTDGWFRYSRNPVYVATWIGLIGWAVLTPHPLVVFLLAPWALMYLLAPIFEEPWLEQQYGEAYTDYKRSTPRFFFGF